MSTALLNPQDYSDSLKRKNGRLYLNEVDLDQFLEKKETPIFLFSKKQLNVQYQKILKPFLKIGANSINIAFSVKSNPEVQIIRQFLANGSFFEVTSLGEMNRVLETGGDPKKIIYTNIVKLDLTIEQAIRSNIGYYAIDSYHDMQRLEKIAKKVDRKIKVLIRVNPLVELESTLFSCTGSRSKIGIPIDLNEQSKFLEIISYCKNSSFFSLVGIHVHLGSQIINIESYRRAMKVISELLIFLQKRDIKLSILDIGGGIPVNYGNPTPGPELFALIIKEEFNTILNQLNIIIESGRFLTASAGILIFSIGNIKQDSIGNEIICLDGSFFNTIPDVIVANWSFPIINLITGDNVPLIKYRLVGATNDTLDSYQDRKTLDLTFVTLQKLSINDKIVFLQAGAYSLSFNSSYCLEKRPKVYFLE